MSATGRFQPLVALVLSDCFRYWGRTAIHETFDEVANDFELNLGKLGQPIRVAVTSGPVSPPIDVTLWLVGQERTVRRLEHAIELIEARAAADTR